MNLFVNYPIKITKKKECGFRYLNEKKKDNSANEILEG